MKQRGRFGTDDVPEGEKCHLDDEEGKGFEFNVPNATEENLAPVLAVVGPMFAEAPTTKVGKTIQQMIAEKGL